MTAGVLIRGLSANSAIISKDTGVQPMTCNKKNENPDFFIIVIGLIARSKREKILRQSTSLC